MLRRRKRSWNISRKKTREKNADVVRICDRNDRGNRMILAETLFMKSAARFDRRFMNFTISVLLRKIDSYCA